MKRKLALIITAFIFAVLLGKSIDIMVRYNMDWIEYIKYSADISYVEHIYLEENETSCGLIDGEIPLCFTNPETGQNSGMLVDYLSQMSIEMATDINVMPMSEEQCLEALKSKNIDIAIVDKTKESQELFDFTEPLYILHGKVLVKDSFKAEKLDDLKDAKLAVVNNEDILEATRGYYREENNVEIIVIDNIEDAIELLNKGVVDAVAGDETQISYMLNQSKGGNYYRFLEYALYRKEVCIALNKEDGKLKKILNKAVISMKKKNLIMQTQSKWFGTFTPTVKDMQSYDYIYKILFAALAIVAFFITWNYMMSKKVSDKTRELFESKDELRVIIDTLSRGIIVITKDNKIIECNNVVLKILKLKREDLLNQDCFEIEELKPYIDLRDEIRYFSYGSSYYCVTNKQFDDGDKILITIEDYTDKYINEKRARQESKMIAVGQLSAGLAHEIRNPLGLIKSYVYIIKRYCVDDVGNHAVSVINESVDRINGLIENLLRFSKLSNEDIKVINISNLIDSIIDLERKNIENEGIAVKINSPKVCKVKVNEDIIKLLLLNLLNNSIDSFKEYFRDDKIIGIDVTADEDNLYIDFSDNGCGIDAETAENIFNPFYTTKESGTGLGLYIISTEIEKIEGSITVDSKVGKGTIFHITIPTKGVKNE